MVAPSPLPDIPQRHLLTALLELNADLPAVAARTRTPLDELTTWANSADVLAWLDAHDHFAEIAREHRELARTSRNLHHLEELAKATDNPVEKRRILCAIIRGSTAILHGRSTRNAPSQRSQSRRGDEGAGGWARETQDRAHHHSRNALEPLPEGGVGVGSFDTSTRPPGGHAPTSRTSAAASPYKSTNPLDILEELEAAEAFLRARSTPAPNQTSPAPAAPQATAPLTPAAPAPIFVNPIYQQDLPPQPKPRTHRATPAHLLAAAGLPAP